MIHDVNELSASLRYVAGWADTLEGLRRHAEEIDTGLLATTSAGPLAEIRRTLREAREFVDSLTQDASPEVAVDYRLPLPERQKVA